MPAIDFTMHKFQEFSRNNTIYGVFLMWIKKPLQE